MLFYVSSHYFDKTEDKIRINNLKKVYNNQKDITKSFSYSKLEIINQIKDNENIK